MKKIVTLLFLGFSAITIAQNDGTPVNTADDANKSEQQVTPAADVNEEIEAPENTVPAQTPTAEPNKEPTQKKQAKNENEKKSAIPFIKKFYFGGTFGATFGKNYSSITVAPTVGYRLRPSLYTGAKVYYTYSWEKLNKETYNYHNYGFGTFLRWYAFSDIYLHVAPEIFNYEYLSANNNAEIVTKDEWVPYLWAGAGIRKRTSRRSWVSVHVLFDLINDKNSPYELWEPNLVIGAGTSF